MPPLTVVHVTDNHLYADAERVNDGLVPAETCRAVLAAAAAAAPSADALVLTGDFTNDDSEASYTLMKALVRGAFPQTPVFFVPGNHEELVRLERVFVPEFVGPAASSRLVDVPLAGEGSRWRLLLLNTFLGGGAVHGGVDASTAAALEEALASADARGEFVLLALHHPPVPPAGELPPWSGNCLREPEALLRSLQAHPCCRVGLHGHLHADTCTRLGHASVYCTPSTCTQTVVQSDSWQIDVDAKPGFRLVTLHEDGSHETAVHRVNVRQVLQ